MSSTAAFYLLSTLGGYLVTSFLLLKYPTLLHQRKKQRFLSKHISHRGGAGENLENTMEAFQHPGEFELSFCSASHQRLIKRLRDYFSCYQTRSAVTIGTDMLELDCHITKDEQVVVSHDENLKRSTGVNVNISDLKYCELPSYLGKLDVPFQRACQCEGKDNRIPLLKEVFDAFPNTPINIDIKVNNNVLIKKVSELVKQYKREHLTVWGNASYEIVEKCYKEAKGTTHHVQKSKVSHLAFRYVYVWVLNEEQEYKRAFDLGATGVMTDYPTKLKDFLHNFSA
ncbi:lysophospholipase D GDPD1 isoform X7 [Marmota monax]|uniref:lysophospholipase D GDPD1 isoform X7 n=1 Tax=Marmota monax TaxID=9995 RepID=UPI001EB02653|nr:lysophospholipase D GDPD1 isoform X7 [Marmota monax]